MINNKHEVFLQKLKTQLGLLQKQVKSHQDITFNKPLFDKQVFNATIIDGSHYNVYFDEIIENCSALKKILYQEMTELNQQKIIFLTDKIYAQTSALSRQLNLLNKSKQ